MKRIVVACGSGVATSQTVASKINSMLEDEGIRATVEAVDIKSLESIIDQVDVYVTIVPGSQLAPPCVFFPFSATISTSESNVNVNSFNPLNGIAC